MDCIFCKIIAGEIPSEKVYEDSKFFAFKDIAPVTPVHVLVVPKEHIQSLAHIAEKDTATISQLLPTIKKIAEQLGLKESGYRVVFNTGELAGQTVPHLHAHILGGKKMDWPGV